METSGVVDASGVVDTARAAGTSGDWRRRLLAGCDEDQVAAITSPAAPLLVVAGAGSGKTRVLTRRIAWRVHDGSAAASHVLALTFTRKAAAELRGRLAALGLPAPVTAGTFHALALAELRRRAAELGRQPPALLDSKARLLALARPSLNRRELLSGIASEIEWAKARLVGPSGYAAAARAARRTTPLDPDEVAESYAAYERERLRRRVLDFDDLLVAFADQIESDPDFAAAQRWRFAQLFVDELQDANPAQLRLLDAWLGGRSDLFAVGDPRQAIYGWNGADPSGVLDFATRYPGATVLALETNYRSSPQVVALAAAALGGGPRSARPDGALPTLRSYPDADAEAAGVAAALRLAHHPGRGWSRCAVLARTNAQLVVLESALKAAGIPVRTVAGTAFLARPAVRRALAELPPGAGTTALREFLGDPVPAGDPAPVSGDDEGRSDLDALCRLGEEYLGLDPLGTAEGFLAFLKETLRGDPSPVERDAVELTTFHRAKGLEWSAVFVTGLEEGFVPIAHAISPEALDEERRLLYVALSRAEDELHCSWAATRRFGNRLVERSPSRYLDTIEAARRRLELAAAPALASARSHLADARARLRRDTG